jgi:hypothetical protein
VAALPADKPVTVWVRGEGCESLPQELVPVAGVNEIRLSCPRLRTVQGIIRGPLPKVVSLHCGDNGRVLSDTRLFRLLCPADQQTLKVQIGGDAAVRQVAIPPDDPALIEISL